MHPEYGTSALIIPRKKKKNFWNGSKIVFKKISYEK